MAKTKTKKSAVEKAGPLKNRKILRDNIQGITKPALQRIMHKAGVKRASGLVYEQLRGTLKVGLEDIIKMAVIHTQNAGRKTLSLNDAVHGIEDACGDILLAVHKMKNKACKTRPPKTGEGKKKFKPGTVALSKIRLQQKQAECLNIPKESFKRLVLETMQDYHDGELRGELRISKDAVIAIQYHCEQYLVSLCRNANAVAIHCDRTTLAAKDIQLARKMMKDQ